MKTEKVQIESLKSAEYNPRIALESGTKDYEQLKKSLNKFGTVVPIIINKDGTVISGHQRLNILKELGQEQTEAIVLDIDKKQEKQLNIALNKVEGRWDWQKLDELLETFTDEELQFTGFADAETNAKSQKVQKKANPSKKMEGGFTIYVSFSSKDTANKWIHENGLNVRFEDTETITINMEEDND